MELQRYCRVVSLVLRRHGRVVTCSGAVRMRGQWMKNKVVVRWALGIRGI